MKNNFFAFAFLSMVFMGCSKMDHRITDGAWQLSQIQNEEVSTSAQATFANNGKVHFNTGVNILNAEFKIDAKKGTLSVKEGPMTLMAGSPKDMEIEQKFLAAVFKSASYKIEGNALTLTDAEGNLLLKFVKKVLV